jgi:hypothetical protein
VAEGVAAKEEAGDLVPVQAVHILAHTALQHLPTHTVIYSPPCSNTGKKFLLVSETEIIILVPEPVLDHVPDPDLTFYEEKPVLWNRNYFFTVPVPNFAQLRLRFRFRI